MLKEAIPSTTKAAFLAMRDGWEGPLWAILAGCQSAKSGFRWSLYCRTRGLSTEIERVFAAMAQQELDALLVSGEGDLYAHRQLIVELAERAPHADDVSLS